MAGSLDGVRVIDFGQYIAGPLAAMLLADQGAEVIRVDPPSGPRLVTPANAVWNRGKRSIVLDLKQNADRETARKLIASADVVVENFRPGVMERLGIGPEASRDANQRLIYLSLPGFAHDDPRADIAAWEGVVGAATNLYTRPRDPVFTALPISSGYAAFLGALSVAMALNARGRDGLGQRIEVPLYDATFTAVGYRAQRFHDYPQPEPLGAGVRTDWFGEHRTKDDRWAYFHLGNKNALDLIAAAGALDWWQAPDARERANALFATKTAQEWEDLAAAAGTELAVCRSSAEWLDHPHARGSKMIVEVADREYGTMLQPGVQARLSATPGAIRGPAPALDADRQSVLAELATPRTPVRWSAGETDLRAALQGVKVLDLCIVLAGPTCGRTLAEFGADVIKIDGPPRAGVLGGRVPSNDAPNSFNIEVNRGKRSIVLDLKTDAGQMVFWKLVEDADVVVENYRRGVIDRLGVGYEAVRARRPNIIYASLNAYGYEGPWAGRPGHEQLAQTATGMSVRFGGDGRPTLQSVALNDFGTGLMGAYAVALALLHRQRSGEGQFVNTALAYTACTLQSAYMTGFAGKVWDEPRGQDATGFGPLQRLYHAADGWFFLGARDDQRAALAAIVGSPDLTQLSDGALAADLESRFASAPLAAWLEKLQAADIGAQPLATVDTMLDDPYARRRGLSISQEHTGFGVIDSFGPAPRLWHTPVTPGRPAPKYGADARAILAEIGLPEHTASLATAGD